MNLLSIKNVLLLMFSVFFFVAGYVTLFYTFTPLPSVDTENVSSKQSIVLVDRNEEFLFDFSINEKRTFAPYEEISKNVIYATLAIEDHLFFEHKGVRIDSFLRALINNIQTLSFSQGGSTVTQQVVKNVFLTTEKKIERKMKEFLLAIKLEKQLSKEEILELYFNTISYGGVSYGIAEASNTFYGKKPADVTIAESAYLAAIPKAPTYYSPYGQNRRDLEDRKNSVLQRMLNHGFITREEYADARAESVYFLNQGEFSIRAPHFVFFVKEHLEKEYGTGLRELEGKKIKTTIDIEIQEEIEKMVQEFAPEIEKKHGAKNVAAIVLSVKTGEILSMVGSRDFFDGEIDGRVNITTSLRQPGSTFKPIAYAEALKKGLTPETIIYDTQTQFTNYCEKDRFESTKSGCYAPINYTGKFKGPTSLRNALAQSINIPAVKVLYIAGVSNVIYLAERMGITSLTENPNHYGLSLVLGGAEVMPIELAQAYSVFANEGVLIPYTWQADQEQPQGKRILPKRVAQDITDILSDDNARAPVFGRNSALHIASPPVAVKTGTTNNARDIWVVGYSPDIVVLVWAGNADSTILQNNAAGFRLAPLFSNIIKKVSKKYGKQGTYFSKNTIPADPGPDILFGIIDTRDPHNILHYIQRERPNQPQKNIGAEPQYNHWEYGVQEWIKEKGLISNRAGGEKPLVEDFSILSPRSAIDPDEIVTVMIREIPLPGTQYEFYINESLIGSSHLGSFSFDPKKIVREKDREVTIRVVANTEHGTYVTEEVYRVR